MGISKKECRKTPSNSGQMSVIVTPVFPPELGEYRFSFLPLFTTIIDSRRSWVPRGPVHNGRVGLSSSTCSV